MTRVIDRGTSQAKSMYIGSAIDDAGLDPYEFRIYCHLKRRAQDGVVWERQDKMAGICMMSRKTVNEVLIRLEEKGWIEQKQRTLKGQQSSNLIYLLEPPCNPELHSRVTDGYTAVSPRVTAEGTPLEGTPLEGLKDGAENRSASENLADQVTLSRAETGTARRGESGKEATSLDTVPGSAALVIPGALAALPGFAEAWGEWVSYRRQRRLTCAVVVLRGHLSRLGKNADPVGMLTFSRENGYQGVFAPNAKGKPQNMQEANDKFIQGMADTKEAIRGVFDD